MADSVLTHFADLPDPRSSRGRQHELSDILTIAICGVICGAESWTEIEQFGGDKERWFRTFLTLPQQSVVKVLRGQRRDISRQIEGAKRRRILKIR